MDRKEQKKRTITIDPRMFISSPYITCPKCKQNDSYGVLLMGRNSYTRRCRECWFDKSYKLPSLDKKLIYIDQFVLSNIAKSLNSELGKGKKFDKWYVDLFSKLDILSKSQLIVCPDSEFHRQESLPYAFKTLKRLYEHLSHGVTFYDLSTISRFQISKDFKKFVGKSKDEKEITCDDLLHGDRNEWQDRLLVTVDWRIDPNEIEMLKKQRELITENSRLFFEYWSNEKHTKFKDLFVRVANEYGRDTVKHYLDYLAKQIASTAGHYKLTESDILLSVMSSENVLVHNLYKYIPDLSYEKQVEVVTSYLQSDRLHGVQFNEIKSLLWAAIEFQIITKGRRSPPNAGMVSDIEMVSALLPYVDAIFVDNDMRNILEFREVKKVLQKYKAKVFSPSNKNDFFGYLDEIEVSTPNSIKEKVIEVYGKNFLKPYLEIFEVQPELQPES